MSKIITLEGKCALVTGGSRGLGLEMSKQLANAGALVWINDIDGPSCERAAAILKSQGLLAFPIIYDVTDRTAIDIARDKIKQRCDGVNILINNAGIGDFVSWPEISEDKWHKMIDVHLTGTFNCSAIFLPDMTAKCWGRIINISSVAAKRGDHMGNAHYTAAKAGIIGLTRSLAANVAASGVTVNAIAPGLVDTELSRQMSPNLKKKTIDRIPIGRLGAPDEIAAAALFLASDWASYIVGETINVNGGSYMD